MLQAQANEQNVSPDVYLMICLTDAQLDDREGLVTGEVLCHSLQQNSQFFVLARWFQWTKHSLSAMTQQLS